MSQWGELGLSGDQRWMESWRQDCGSGEKLLKDSKEINKLKIYKMYKNFKADKPSRVRQDKISLPSFFGMMLVVCVSEIVK